MASLKEQQRQVKRGIYLLAYREVNGTLSPAERQLLRGLRKELPTINRKLSAPKRKKPSTGAPRTTEGPAGGITSIVSGGAPGNGKRA